MEVSKNIFNVGVIDKKIDLFEGQYKLKEGIKYNSYLILDEKVALLDTVDINFGDEWIANIEKVLNGRTIDYLIIHHMEPDHSANIANIISKYPEIKVVLNCKTLQMLKQFFPTLVINSNNIIEVKEGDILNLGTRSLKFVFAPFVHWPEVMMSYELNEGILFSSDAFGTFEDSNNPYVEEARRYFFGIVGKYGIQVKNLLNKAKTLQINKICSLHGEVIDSNIGYYVDLYQKWANYDYEDDGVVIAYCSIYGNTQKACLILKDELEKRNVKVEMFDLARDDKHLAIAKAFQYSKLVLACPTYNNALFPPMNEYIEALKERNYQKRTVSLIENGSWAPMSKKLMLDKLATLKDIVINEKFVSILSSVNDKNLVQIQDLAETLK